MITQQLTELAKSYLAIVDSGDESRQGAERTNAHDEMMAQMRIDGVPFNSRVEARWIARWLVSNKPNGLHGQMIMFAKPLSANPGMASIIFNSPPDDNREELVPVLVTIQSFEEYTSAAFETSG
jgi:hypothetical protein